MRLAVWPIWLAMVGFWLGANRTVAEDSPATRLSLQGLTGVGVRVITSGPGGKAVVSEHALRTAVEKQLRQAGVRVLTPAEKERSAQRPCLVVSVALLRLSSGEYLYSLHVELNQWVASLARPDLPVSAAVPMPAVTWSAPNVFGIAPGDQTAGRVQDAALRMAGRFVAAYQQANPRTTAGP